MSENITATDVEEETALPKIDNSSVNIIEKHLNENSPSTKFALIDIDKLVANVSEMNFIEASRMKQRINQEYENFKMAKNLLDSINNMNNIDTMNRKILETNILNNTEYKEDSEAFMSEYDANVERFEALVAALDTRIAEYDSINKTSGFMNTELVNSIDKRIKEYHEAGMLDESNTMKYLATTRKIYNNRDDLSYIKNKASIAHIVKKYRSEIKNHEDECVKKLRKGFLQYFTTKQMEIFENKLLDLFNQDSHATILFMYHMYRIMDAEKNTALYNWCKVFIMNVLDIEAKIYDLSTPADEYYAEIQKLYDIYK